MSKEGTGAGGEAGVRVFSHESVAAWRWKGTLWHLAIQWAATVAPVLRAWPGGGGGGGGAGVGGRGAALGVEGVSGLLCLWLLLGRWGGVEAGRSGVHVRGGLRGGWPAGPDRADVAGTPRPGAHRGRTAGSAGAVAPQPHHHVQVRLFAGHLPYTWMAYTYTSILDMWGIHGVTTLVGAFVVSRGKARGAT